MYQRAWTQHRLCCSRFACSTTRVAGARRSATSTGRTCGCWRPSNDSTFYGLSILSVYLSIFKISFLYKRFCVKRMLQGKVDSHWDRRPHPACLQSYHKRKMFYRRLESDNKFLYNTIINTVSMRQLFNNINMIHITRNVLPDHTLGFFLPFSTCSTVARKLHSVLANKWPAHYAGIIKSKKSVFPLLENLRSNVF